MVIIKVLPTPDELITAAADLILGSASAAIQERGSFSMALSGGRTPLPLYEYLSQDRFDNKPDWTKIHFFWGDERAIPPDHPESNFFQAQQLLLKPRNISIHNIHRIQGELNPDQAASIYQDELQAVLGTGERFDLILLGMGVDGHTASLFPGTTALEERERAVVAVYVEKMQRWRVTLTLPIINAARHVLFLVSGDAKAEVLAQINAGVRLPASLVQPSHGELTWLADQNAASNLIESPI